MNDETESAFEQPSSEEVKEVQRELRKKLFPETDGVQLEKYIVRFLRPHVPDAQKRAAMAHELAVQLIATVCFFPKGLAPLQELIENRPQQLAALLEASDFDTLWRIAPAIARLPRPKRRREKVKTETERKRRVRNSKRLHDFRRRFERDGPGLIEIQFGPATASPTAFDSITSIILGVPDSTHRRPGGECLDKLLRGEEARMTGLNSLQSLFGRHRKLLPKDLVRRRAGRTFLYNFAALSQCFEFLLKQNQWLPNPAVRQTVLRNVWERAAEVAKPEIASQIQRVLSPYLVSGNFEIPLRTSPAST